MNDTYYYPRAGNWIQSPPKQILRPTSMDRSRAVCTNWDLAQSIQLEAALANVAAL